LSQEKVFKTLTNLGLSKLEARVYIYLAKRNPQKARDIVKALKLIKQQIYPTLRRLQSKGMVTSTLERPARFSAVPFEKMLDLCMKAKMEEAQRIQQNRDELISDWQAIKIREKRDATPRFTVIEGRNYIYSRIQQMIQETKNQLSIITTVSGLVRADQFGVIDTAFRHPLKSKIKFRFLIELSEQNITAIKNLLKNSQTQTFHFEGRTPDLGQRLTNRIIIKDENEAMFFIDTGEDLHVTEQEGTCLWTNSKTLVQAFTALFEDLWHNSTDIEEKIVEIETGKPTAKTYIMSDVEISKKKFCETLKSAKDEIVMITPLEDFVELWKNTSSLKDCARRGVSLKIMTPITVENLRTAKQLSESCDIRHLPESYLRTTLVDGLHLFQFKTPISGKEKEETLQHFKNAFYTTDSEYVEKTKTMLNELWKNASVLSSVTLESILNPRTNGISPLHDEKRYSAYRKTTGYIKDQLGLITEKELLNKICKRYIPSARDPLQDTTIMYGNGARALINPPEHLDLPKMIITVFHCNERSTFGTENWLIVQIPQETPKGEMYVAVTIMGDNPLATDWRKKIHKGTPLEQNLHLIKKDELQVRQHGNILFTGWTVPIPLYPTENYVPPSCMFFEGYRELGTGVVESKPSLGRMQKSEFYGFEAFVTFFHPSSKYSGPGTDGVIFRDMIVTSYPHSVQ